MKQKRRLTTKSRQDKTSGMNQNDLDRFDPVKNQKANLVRAFVRMPKDVKSGLKKKAAGMKPKLSLNAYVLHLCIEDLRK